MTTEALGFAHPTATELDETTLAEIAGGGHTGGRFLLEIAGHNTGFATAPPVGQPQGGQTQGNTTGIIAILIGL